MLSKRERQVLSAIETRLSWESPQLADEFTRFDAQRFRGGAARTGVALRRLLMGVVVLLIVLGLVCGIAGSASGGVAFGVLALSLGAYLAYDLRSRRRGDQ